MLHDADFQLVTNSVEDEIATGWHVSELIHGIDAVANNQMTFQDWVCLREMIKMMKRAPREKRFRAWTHVIGEFGHEELLENGWELVFQASPGLVTRHKVSVTGGGAVQLLVKSIPGSKPQRITGWGRMQEIQNGFYEWNVTSMKRDSTDDLLTSTLDQSVISQERTYKECLERGRWCERSRWLPQCQIEQSWHSHLLLRL